MNDSWSLCPSCGEPIQIIPGKSSTACAHCGSKILNPELEHIDTSTSEKVKQTDVVPDNPSSARKREMTDEERDLYDNTDPAAGAKD